jgi:hypothetical protein
VIQRKGVTHGPQIVQVRGALGSLSKLIRTRKRWKQDGRQERKQADDNHQLN